MTTEGNNRMSNDDEVNAVQTEVLVKSIQQTDVDRHENKNFRTALPQILATLAKNLLLLAYGATLGFPTVVIAALSLGDDVSLKLTPSEISWFSSINLICVPLGCMLSAAVTSPLGRKRSMMIMNIPFVIAWLIFYYADSVAMLYTSLVITGFTGGLLEAPVLTYVAEISQPHLRGALTATAGMGIMVAIFIQFILGNILPWRRIAAINICFPVAAFISLCFVPESPYWLVGKGRLKDAERSLCWLRGWTQPSKVHAEYSAMVAEHTAPVGVTPRPTWRQFTLRTFYKPYILVSLSFFFGHFGGMTTLLAYAGTIFYHLESPIDKYLATLYLGFSQLIGCLTFTGLVHWTGKRPITIISTFGNSVCFVSVATFAYLKDHGSIEGHGWVPTALLIVTAFFSHMGIRLLPWVLIGEVFPLEVRNIASAASGATGYIFGFAVNKLYLRMVGAFTMAGTFWFYGAISFIGMVVLYFLLPETEDRTFSEIERHFRGEINLFKYKKQNKVRYTIEHAKNGTESQM